VAKEKAKKEKFQANEVVAIPLESHETTPILDQSHDDGIAAVASDSSLLNVVHATSKQI